MARKGEVRLALANLLRLLASWIASPSRSSGQHAITVVVDSDEAVLRLRQVAIEAAAAREQIELLNVALRRSIELASLAEVGN
jgi:hypothetical protein